MLKLLIFILFIFTIINPAYSTSVSPTQLNIANVTNFPHEIETKFIINFNSNSSHERNNQIYLIIKDGKKVKEKLLINLGSNLNYTNKSKYFETISISQNNQLEIRFSKYSQGKVLEIRQNLNDKTNFKSSKKLFRDFIDLIFQLKLNLTYVNHMDKSYKQYLTVQCMSNVDIEWNMLDRRGNKENVVPVKEMKWTKQIEDENEVSNYLEVTLQVQPTDQKKSFACISGNKQKKLVISYYEHPEKVEIIKSNPSNFSTKNVNVLKCNVIGGMNSNINISWNTKDGPVDYNKYLSLIGNSKNSIKIENAPDWSRWNISCYVTSDIFNSTRQYESSIEFGMEPTDQSLMSNIAGELKDQKEINKKQNDLLSQISKTLLNQKEVNKKQNDLLSRIFKKLKVMDQQRQEVLVNIPSPPLNLSFYQLQYNQQKNQTSFLVNFVWDPPTNSYGEIIAYTVKVRLTGPKYVIDSLRERSIPIPEFQTNVTTSNFTYSLGFGKVYTYTVAAINTKLDVGLEAKLNLTTKEMAPDMYPTSIKFNRYIRGTVIISWQTPPPETQNGVIIHYQVAYHLNEEVNSSTFYTVNSFTSSVFIDGLQPNLLYVFRIRAATKVGYSPWSPQIKLRTTELETDIFKRKFIEIKWKVSKPIIKPSAKNMTGCADLADNNEIFGFKYINFTCILYPTFDYCDNNLKYEVKTIYARKSEWNKISSSAAYQILRNVNSVFIDQDWDAKINLDNKKETKSIFKVGNETFLAISTESGIRAAAVGNYKFYDYINWNLNLNLAKWLTRGRCVKIESCAFTLLDRNKYLNSTGVILLLFNYEKLYKINEAVYNKIESRDWGVVFFGPDSNNKYNKMAAKYGFGLERTFYKSQELILPRHTC